MSGRKLRGDRAEKLPPVVCAPHDAGFSVLAVGYGPSLGGGGGSVSVESKRGDPCKAGDVSGRLVGSTNGRSCVRQLAASMATARGPKAARAAPTHRLGGGPERAGVGRDQANNPHESLKTSHFMFCGRNRHAVCRNGALHRHKITTASCRVRVSTPGRQEHDTGPSRPDIHERVRQPGSRRILLLLRCPLGRSKPVPLLISRHALRHRQLTHVLDLLDDRTRQCP